MTKIWAQSDYYKKKNRRATELAMISIQIWPDVLPGEVLAQYMLEADCPSGLITTTRHLIKLAPELGPKVVSGELTLYKALELAKKGERKECPTCGGKGHIFALPNNKAKK
jgi:hypothetical protein